MQCFVASKDVFVKITIDFYNPTLPCLLFINGEMVIDEAKSGTEYEFYIEESTYEPQNDTETVKYIGIPKNVIFTCEISFKTDNLELINCTIDLVEGRFHQNGTYHWNALNIQMNVNREWL